MGRRGQGRSPYSARPARPASVGRPRCRRHGRRAPNELRPAPHFCDWRLLRRLPWPSHASRAEARSSEQVRRESSDACSTCVLRMLGAGRRRQLCGNPTPLVAGCYRPIAAVHGSFLYDRKVQKAEVRGGRQRAAPHRLQSFGGSSRPDVASHQAVVGPMNRRARGVLRLRDRAKVWVWTATLSPLGQR